MLEHVTNEYLFARHIDRRENLGEKLARLANERTSGLVLLSAGGFANAHQLRVRIPLPGHRVGSSCVERATLALLHFLGDLVERAKLENRVRHQIRFIGSYNNSFLEWHVVGRGDCWRFWVRRCLDRWRGL